MTTAPDRGRPGLAVLVLLGLMTLAQFGIFNEIRYQGCLARYYEATFATEGATLEDTQRSFECSRIPFM